jgi:hypothetical protein
MVERASLERKRIQIHNFSTSSCGFGRKNLLEQTFSGGDSTHFLEFSIRGCYINGNH